MSPSHEEYSELKQSRPQRLRKKLPDLPPNCLINVDEAPVPERELFHR